MITGMHSLMSHGSLLEMLMDFMLVSYRMQIICGRVEVDRGRAAPPGGGRVSDGDKQSGGSESDCLAVRLGSRRTETARL